MLPGSLGFREESFQPCQWSLTPCRPYRTRRDRSTWLLPSPYQNKVGHFTRVFSELHTPPGCTSVNASPCRLPDTAHHSRPRRLARSYLVRLFHSLPSSGFCRRLLEHFIRSRQHVRRNRQADLFRCFQIDDEFELRRLLHRKSGQLCSF
jgi:hypothetical protein